MKKGQVAVELFALVAALVLIYLVITTVEKDRDAMIYNSRVQMDGKRISEVVSTEINTAVVVGTGYSHRFSVPERLATNMPFTIAVDSANQFVSISWDQGSYLMPIITSNVTGNPQSGWNFITNQGGRIYIVPG